VTWMQLLHIQGIYHGPLFPMLNNAHTKFLRDDEGDLQRQAVESYRANLSKVFQYVGGCLRDCTSHSIRHNVVKWAARCGAQQADIMRGGRWVETSAKFLGYWKQEILKTKQMLGMTKQEDTIFTFWVWETTAYEAVGSSRGM